MRVAFLLERFPVVSETFILRQITGLLDLGHEVDIYAQWRGDDDSVVHPAVDRYDLRRRTSYLDLPVAACFWEQPVRPLRGKTWLPGEETPIWNARRAAHALPRLVRTFARAPRLTLATLDRREYGYQADSLSAAYRLAALAGRGRGYDVVHAHFGPIGNNFRFVRALWRAPLVVSFHGYDLSTWPRQEGEHVYRALFRTADAITTHSNYAVLRLRTLGCPVAKIRMLPSGIDPAQFTFRERSLRPHEPPRLLTIARLVPIKGVEYALRAVDRLRCRWPRVRYDIVGEGPEREHLEAVVAQLGLEDNVRFHGAQTEVRVRVLLEKAHLFIVPSINLAGDEEGLPVVLLEAQATGLPLVATRTGGISEGVLDGESGHLVADRDPEALCDALLSLLENPERWPEIGRRGRTHVETNYDIRRLNRELVGIYEDVAATLKQQHARRVGAAA